MRTCMRKLLVRSSLLVALWAAAGMALAADRCPSLRSQQSDPLVATRIAAIACDEHMRWNRPFIDPEGRIASFSSHEAEANGLADGGAPWRRVARYWQDAGLLGQVAQRSGASDCLHAARNPGYPGMGCRGFVVDSAWSAAFVSWVMQRAGLPGFRHSASHFDYVRAARVSPASSPYTYMEPLATPPAVGDMLCYVRSGRVQGFRGLGAIIDSGANGLPMHCDVVVAAGAGKAYLIGGNLNQAVSMRVLNLNANGQWWGLPMRTDGEVQCSPDTAAACNFHRQDWAVLLKLKPQHDLAKLGPVAPPRLLPDQQPMQQCCVNCVVGSGVPRCPAAQSQPDQ